MTADRVVHVAGVDSDISQPATIPVPGAAAATLSVGDPRPPQAPSVASSSPLVASGTPLPPVLPHHDHGPADSATLHDNLGVLKARFVRAWGFVRPLLSAVSVDGTSVSSAPSLVLSDDTKLRFYAFYKQATHGDCDTAGVGSSPADQALHRKWQSCQGMRRRDVRPKCLPCPCACLVCVVRLRARFCVRCLSGYAPVPSASGRALSGLG